MAYIANYSILPLDQGAHIGNAIGHVVERIHQRGLPYKVTAMGTQIEGDLDTIVDLFRECEKLLEQESERFYTTLTLDYQKGTSGRLQEQVDSVERHLGHAINK